MITDSEDRSMIAELEQIIQTEEAKPEAERDVDLIDDCIREIAELKGLRANYSDEEIDRITDKLVKVTEEKRKRKRFIRLAAGIAAAFVIVSGVTACAINPALINWFAKVVRMPFGTSLNQDKLTYFCHGSVEEYESIKNLIDSKKLNIYYPSILPDGVKIEHIEYFDDDIDLIGFKFNSEDIHFSVQLNIAPTVGDNSIKTIEVNDLQFNVYSDGSHYISCAEIDKNTYTIQSNSIDDLILIVGGLRKDP